MKHSLRVKDGKVWCDICRRFHRTEALGDGLLADEEHNKLVGSPGHKLGNRIPLKHIMYVAHECECGKIVIDGEQ
jgi:hypothetical protein